MDVHLWNQQQFKLPCVKESGRLYVLDVALYLSSDKLEFGSLV